ncbi:E3 ubiquitin-protein ligase BRE1 [Hypsizygus marmoreus]|uniref:E3 ubiquitin protein ligase n=1 Tax=Hypsizygus marmoreus TaxID=39966 RepID=A0A369JZ64_HYPMA|nr:E3 ubiquitin-protein ligase BRE1 [Hypsizygus marmoreus]
MKRPFTDEEDTPTAKKRVLTGPNGSPHVNGSASEQEEPTEGDNLELFRKEAIFRRMRHYSREHERSQSRIAELERRKHTCEAGLAAMSACWSQLLGTIRLLVKPEDMPEVKDDMFDFTVHIRDNAKPDFAKTLKENMNATQTLVTKLVRAGDLQGASPASDALKECQKATTECIALRSQIDIMHVKLQETEAQKDEYHAALVAAENRFDRLRSKTVQAIQSRAVEKKPEVKEESTEEPQRKPSSPESRNSPVHGNGICDPVELDVLRELVASREAKIAELERQAAVFRDEKTLLESEIKQPSFETIVSNPHYKILLEHSATLQATATENRTQVTRLMDELKNLKAHRKEWEEGVYAAANQSNVELRNMMAKRDAENARLRDQREQQAAEITERKQKDHVKIASLQEFKALADSRGERIAVLESDLRRHKAQLAANAGNEELMMFFANGSLEEAAYIESLKDRVSSAENRVAALEQTLSISQDDNPNVVEHMKAEADALQKLSQAEAQLARYKTVYGDPSTLPPNESILADQLKLKEDEIQKLRLLDIQHTQAQTSLYAELDKLSAAWEALDRQVKSKVFELSGLEERLQKSGLDKAKSDNKFFAAMRDKEAIESERKNLVRNMEKQVKVVEKLVDTEKNLSSQLSALEKELSLQKSINDAQAHKLEMLAGDVAQWTGRAEGEKKKVSDMRGSIVARERAVDALEKQLWKQEADFIRARKELEHKRTETASTHPEDKEAEHLMKILKCSVCKQTFRNTVITKCMHTFCRECVDARISTRQRKCPACNVPFSQSDVLYGMYFQ